MTIPWPSSLPTPQRSGYGWTPQDATHRTDGQFGLTAVRSHQDAVLVESELVFMMTEAQHQTFRNFLKYDCHFGSTWVTGMQLHNGTASVRFTGSPKAEQEGNLWRVTIGIERAQ